MDIEEYRKEFIKRVPTTEDYLNGIRKYAEYLQELPNKENKTAVEKEFLDALIRTGVLNTDGSPKESIVTETHLG